MEGIERIIKVKELLLRLEADIIKHITKNPRGERDLPENIDRKLGDIKKAIVGE